MDIGQAIKKIRLQRNMTQTQLAEKCSMSTNAICYLETGRNFPPKATLDRICSVLGVPQSWLLLASIAEEDFPENKRILFRTQLVPLRKELISD